MICIRNNKVGLETITILIQLRHAYDSFFYKLCSPCLSHRELIDQAKQRGQSIDLVSRDAQLVDSSAPVTYVHVELGTNLIVVCYAAGLVRICRGLWRRRLLTQRLQPPQRLFRLLHRGQHFVHGAKVSKTRELSKSGIYVKQLHTAAYSEANYLLCINLRQNRSNSVD